MRYGFRMMALILTLLASTGAGAWEPEQTLEPDALTWLREECPSDFFAAKPRFSARRTERLVRRLYAEGALDVKMARVLGEFAGLRVFLPVDPERRRALIALVNNRLTECSLAVTQDTGQEDIVLWFC